MLDLFAGTDKVENIESRRGNESKVPTLAIKAKQALDAV